MIKQNIAQIFNINSRFKGYFSSSSDLLALLLCSAEKIYLMFQIGIFIKI